MLYLVITRRLFGVRGGKQAYEARLRSESLMDAAINAAAAQPDPAARPAPPATAAVPPPPATGLAPPPPVPGTASTACREGPDPGTARDTPAPGLASGTAHDTATTAGGDPARTAP